MAEPTDRSVRHLQSGQILVKNARWCDTFLSRMRGFTFKRKLAAGESLVLVDDQESRLNAAITMLFVFFDLGVIWVNGSGQVVDKRLARSWRLSYSPVQPAQYVIESHPQILDQVQIGDVIEFIEVDLETEF